MKVPEPEVYTYIKLPSAIYEVDHKGKDVEYRLDHYHRHCLVAEVEEADHYHGIENDPDDIQRLLEDEILVCLDDRTPDAHRKGKCQVGHQKEHHYAGTAEFDGCHRVPEKGVHIEIKPQPYSECDDSYDEVQQEEHSEHLILFFRLLFRPELRGVSDNRIAESEIKYGQVRNHGCNQRVQAVFALSHHPEHVRCVQQTDDRVQEDYDIVQDDSCF